MSFISTRDRFTANGRQPLTDEQIARFAPSAFATEAHDSRSERFAVIPTAGIIAAMRKEGFEPFSAKQARTRDVTKRDFTKHMIRFRHVGQAASPRALQVGETFPEVVLVNANDGSSAYKLMAGVFRLVCLNGMVVAERETGQVSVHHKGDVRRQVIEGSYQVLQESRRAVVAATDWARIGLNRDEQMALAEAAHTVRFAEADGTVNTPIRADQLLVPRRHADGGADLWSTFNRIQENVIRGGLSAFARDDRGRRLRRVTTKEVQGIDGDVRLNRALWALGERMAQLRG
jgi:hypothetical protein